MEYYWFNKLLDVLMVQTNSENEKLMVLYLDKELKKLKLPYHIDAVGNLIVTKGKAKTYPCVTSHMDTVHDFVDDFKIYKDTDDNNVLFAMSNKRRVGIGGDDKCGIFVCLYLLKVIPQIKVVFFSREESGCKGSTGMDKIFFNDCRYLIQLDRKGNRDFIQTYWGNKTISHDFSSEIGLIKKKYKYKNCTGTVTDVMKLWNNRVGVSCVNLSCGYYKPHTAYEYVSVDALWNSMKFTEEIVINMKPKKYASLPPEPTVIKAQAVSYTSYDKYAPCDKCKQYKKEALLYEKGKQKFCYSCLKELNLSINNVEKKSYLFACYECGIKTSEMKVGNSLKYMNGELYCSDCAALFYVGDKEPVKCWVCEKPIPKDHKIIERYGTQICEECAYPSDTIILENQNERI